jgi:glyoxylase-like metal-dependent hydrolase (beta-lactamase superfamily II)
MKITRRWVAAGWLVGLLGVALAAATLPAKAQSAVQGLRLYVMDGGSIIINAPERFGLTREQVKNSNMSCPVYLIVHPRGTLLFDTGLGDRYAGRPFNEAVLGDLPGPPPMASFVLVTKTVKSQLEAIGYPASKIDYLALSHPHVDHIGNANDFAGSTFLVHKGDYNMMFGPEVKFNPAYAALKTSKTKIIEGDYDVFGDGTVVLKFTPGHTPGHQSLYLKLARTGGVVLSGDLYHYPEDLTLNAMPDREKGPGVTEASRKALDAFLKETGAQLWIGHDINFFSKQKHAPEYYD